MHGAAVVKRNPYTWYFVWHLVPRLKFLLPHERDYFGLRHLQGTMKGLLLDVGANSEISALGFRSVGIRYDILSIEANRYYEPSLRRLKQSIRGFDYRIIGAGRQREKLSLFIPVYRGIPMHALASVNLEYARRAVKRDFSPRVYWRMVYLEDKIEVVPLDALELSPNIIKIDVEGSGDQVLLGLRRTISEHRPHIFIEYDPSEMRSVEEFLKALNYLFFIYDSGSDTFALFREDEARQRWEDSPLQVNLFCVPKEKAATLPVSTPRETTRTAWKTALTARFATSVGVVLLLAAMAATFYIGRIAAVGIALAGIGAVCAGCLLLERPDE
jgi:FkbM family methyltransferase